MKQTCHTRKRTLEDWRRARVTGDAVWLVWVVGHSEREDGMGGGIIILRAAAGNDRRQLGPTEKQRDKVMRSEKLVALLPRTGYTRHACCWDSVGQAPPCSGVMDGHGACSGLALVTRADGRTAGSK